MDELYPLFFGNLSDGIPSVRQGAAMSLGNVVKAYGMLRVCSLLYQSNLLQVTTKNARTHWSLIGGGHSLESNHRGPLPGTSSLWKIIHCSRFPSYAICSSIMSLKFFVYSNLGNIVRKENIEIREQVKWSLTRGQKQLENH